MEKNYLKYTAGEMVDDHDFLHWLNHLPGTKMDQLLEENVQFARELHQARSIKNFLKVADEPVSQENINEMWEKISRFERDYLTRLRKRRLYGHLKYAAAVALIFVTSVIGYRIYTQQEAEKFYSFTTDKTIQQSVLILSSGKVIDLKKDESTIRINAQNHAIKINNDTLISLGKRESESPSVVMNQVVVPYGKKSFIELADGTKVWLNAGSKMGFPDSFTGSQREVFLEGEAYFEVTSDKKSPFFVKTKEVMVQVLGTRFNVSAYDADQEVLTVLVEGSVSLSGKHGMNFFEKEVVLKGHQKALYNKDNQTTQVSEEKNPDNYTAWTKGWFPFYKEPLNQVFKKVERYYNVQFVYNEHFPTGDLISGKLDLKDSIDVLMKVLADVAALSYRIDGNKITIELNKEMPMRK